MKKGLFGKVLSVMLVLAMVLSFVPVRTASAEGELTKQSISSVLSAKTGEQYKVEGVVTLVDGKNVWIQDETGSIVLYLSQAATDVKLGDTVIGQGKLSEYKGIMQLGSATFEKSSGMTLTARETSIAALSNKDAASYIKLVGLEVTKIDDGGGKYSQPNIYLTDGKDEIQLYKAVINKNEDGSWQYKVGDKLTVTGAYTFYNTTKEIRNTVPEEFRLYDAKLDSILQAGNEVLIYAVGGESAIAAAETKTIGTVPATVEGSFATADNGARIFKIEQNGDFYRFYNATDGYLCANGTGSNAFYAKEASVDADWRLIEDSKGYYFESQSAKYKNNAQYLEYYGGSVTTYSKKTSDAYFFKLLKVTDKVTEGIVNKPVFATAALPSANINTDYSFNFSVAAYFGTKSVAASVNGKDLTLAQNGEAYSVTVPAELVTGTEIKVTLKGVDNKGVEFTDVKSIKVVDEPVFGDVLPAAKSQTLDNKKPAISVVVGNVGKNPSVEMKVAGTVVDAKYADGKVTYTPAKNLADGLTNVSVKVTREDGVSAVKSWNFTVGEAKEQLYFGQLHAHTAEYSDGAGTYSEALDYIAGLPESANVDFVAFTDHSNYFDTTSAANPEGALYDMSLASAASNEKWDTYKKKAADFNATHNDVLALAGFEMTWSGGPGHINTFNTPGIVSRNNATLNNKTGNAGLQAYYNLLSEAAGADALSQLNHPGSTFGTFIDFSYWNAMIDTRVFLVEVGNGEGQIGAGGYYPSYEYYTMALDKGWHVAPSNNQDNHKGKWGNANDARDVILTDDFTEEGLYQAIREYKVYATEDKNLEIYYTVNGLPLGSVIEEVPEKLNISVRFADPDATDSISKVEIIVNSGKTAYVVDDPAKLAEGVVNVTLDPDYSYYYVRITEGDGDIAVTAPVWVGETLKLGISAVECGTATPVTNEALTLTTTLFNSEDSKATVKSIVYTTEGSKVIGTDTKGYTVDSLGILAIPFEFTPTKAKVMTVTATVTIEQKGIEYTFSMDITLDVLDSDELVYIGIDGSHYNEYVAGNYKDSMGNFGKLVAEYAIRTVQFNTEDDLIAACSNDKYKAIILTAPSRRLEAAQQNPGVYSDKAIKALKSFSQKGGMIIIAGWSDYYENYDAIKNNSEILHMAETQNKLLEALGSSIRISDDATNDAVLNGGQTQRLYFSSYNTKSYLFNRVEVDPEHPNDVLYSERYSQYGGATIYTVDKKGNPTTVIPSSVTPLVYAHATTYSTDSDSDGLGGDNVPKYAYAEGDNRLLVLASEELKWGKTKATVIVAGAAFMSNFEVQASISDSGAEKNYSNYKICENLAQHINPLKITSIKEVQAQTEAGIKYTIEGVVTSNASGYDKDTAFFDCIYVQDSTAGICCFPVAGNFKIGDKVRITGTTDWYQGEAELQVTSIEKIGKGSKVKAANVTASQINDGSVLGSLVTLKGTVDSVELANGLVQTIMVKDASGKLARVFIDGYITTSLDFVSIKVGDPITVTGLASYDNTFATEEQYYARIRVRNRADVSVGKDSAVTYTIQKGDTLWGIAKKFLGNGNLYKAIFEANKDVLKSATSIHKGTKIVIPNAK